MVRDTQLEFLDRNPVIKSQGRGYGSRSMLSDSIMSNVVTDAVGYFIDRDMLHQGFGVAILTLYDLS